MNSSGKRRSVAARAALPTPRASLSILPGHARSATSQARPWFPAAIRIATPGAVLCLVWMQLASLRFSFADGLAAFLLALLLCRLRRPTASARDTLSVTLTFPLVFAATLWLGPVPAALAAWLAALLAAHLGRTNGRGRSYARFHGAALAGAAFAAGGVWEAAAPGRPGLSGSALSTATTGSPAVFSLLTVAALAALAFSLTGGLLLLGGDWPAVRRMWQTRAGRRQLRRRLRGGLPGMLFVVLLAPCGAIWGFWGALPITGLLWHGHRSASLITARHRLRKQLRTAQRERDGLRMRAARSGLYAQEFDRDALTGLWNHARMVALLQAEVHRALRYHRPLSLLLLEVENLRRFDAVYGPVQSRRLLQHLAAVLSDSIRRVDTLGRYGGEAFLIILPETPREGAARLAERLRAAIKTRAGLRMDAQTITPTVHAGIASCPEEALHAAGLIEQAEESLIRAQREGSLGVAR